jgi:LysM repeat protein
MDGRRGSPARLLAPIALIAFVFALVVVIGSSDAPDDSDDDRGRASQRQAGGTGTTTAEGPGAPVPGNFYTVKTGDTLAAIAETVGVPVERLQELNPDLDPQALVSGQKIRLRE